jgi:hypothetical protein
MSTYRSGPFLGEPLARTAPPPPWARPTGAGVDPVSDLVSIVERGC